MFERCLYFNLNALTRRVNKIWDRTFADLKLSPAHAYLLRLVLSNPGITQKHIARELRLDKSTVTRFIDTLQQEGYLKRKKVGREQIISPTRATIKIGEELNRRGDTLYRRMLSDLGNAPLVDLVKQLRQAAGKMK